MFVKIFRSSSVPTLALVGAFGVTGGATDAPWTGDALAHSLARLDQVETVARADEFLRRCEARLIAPAAHAAPGADPRQVRTLVRLGDLFGERHGLSFVLVPTLGGVITRAFEGVVFDRAGRVTTNFAIKNVDRLEDDLRGVMSLWVKHLAKFNDRAYLRRRMVRQSEYLTARLATAWTDGIDPARLGDRFERLHDELETFARAFVARPPRGLRLFVDIDRPGAPAAADVDALKAFTRTHAGLRIVLLWPDDVRIFMNGDHVDQDGRALD